MKLEAAILIVSQSNDLDVRESYSGRGMYGKETSGVTGSWEAFTEALGEAILNTREFDKRKILSEAVSRLKMDNMGHDYIFY